MTPDRSLASPPAVQRTSSPRRRRLAVAIIMAVFGAFTQAACGETTRYYQCQGDVQCELAKACARQCDDEYGYDGTCRKFSDTAPTTCGRFLGVPTQAHESRVRVKRDPFR
jgi:hypothetical protein